MTVRSKVEASRRPALRTVSGTYRMIPGSGPTCDALSPEARIIRQAFPIVAGLFSPGCLVARGRVQPRPFREGVERRPGVVWMPLRDMGKDGATLLSGYGKTIRGILPAGGRTFRAETLLPTSRLPGTHPVGDEGVLSARFARRAGRLRWVGC